MADCFSHKSGVRPVAIIKAETAVIVHSPHPTIGQNPKQSLIVLYSHLVRAWVLPKGSFLRFRPARLKALFNFEKRTETGNFFISGGLWLV